MTHIIDIWEKCYPSNWKGLIVPAAMSHPAKFSSRLIRRIYDHMKAEGWVNDGDTVLDPFGGVALGALEAMRHGLNWTGIELEAKFVDLGSQNIDAWDKRFGTMPHWGKAVLLQGDSRFILNVIRGVNGAVSSPPYESARIGQESGQEHCGHGDQYGSTDGQLGAMHPGDFVASISSPPFRQSEGGGGTPEPREGGSIDKALYTRHAAGNGSSNAYGVTDGNLANMDEPKGDFDASISSPPFMEHSADGGWQMLDKYAKEGKLTVKQAGGDPNKTYPSWSQDRDTSYGETEGQMSNLPAGDFNAAISSPPYADSDQNYREGWKRFHDGHEPLFRNDAQREAEYGTETGQLSAMKPGDFDSTVSSPPYSGEVVRERGQALEENRMLAKGYVPNGRAGVEMMAPYGDTNGNIGNEKGETFWSAARQIVEQVYIALVPGAHAVWVVKDYVKNKERVPFSDQWRHLCESVGFVTLHEHHASLVHHKGTSNTLEGGTVEHITESKSFFRRLAEKKGSPRIDHETVFCMVKQ